MDLLWIGGPPGVGKTAVARRIARRHGLRLYSADTRTWEHRDRAIAAGNPAAVRWESLTPERRWDKSADELLAMSLHEERGPMVVEDIHGLPSSPLVLAEGSVLPASAVSAGIVQPDRSIWLIPTWEFQQAQLAGRGTDAGPARLYAHLRDVIERDAQEHGVPILTVDGSMPLPDVAAVVESRFAPALAAGSVARTRAERQILLREINEAIVGQVHGYFQRPWAAGDGADVERDFVCECGDANCEVELRLTVKEASRGPVLAAGHRSDSG